MGKIFTYTKITEAYGDEEYGEEFEYEVGDEELVEALTTLIYEDYFFSKKLHDECEDYSYVVKKGIRSFIIDYDDLDNMIEWYKPLLKEYFEEEAMNS